MKQFPIKHEMANPLFQIGHFPSLFLLTASGGFSAAGLTATGEDGSYKLTGRT